MEFNSKIMFGCYLVILVAIAVLIFAGILPIVAGGLDKYENLKAGSPLINSLPLLGFLIIGLAQVLLQLYAIALIITAKNEKSWKMMWGVVTILFGIIGVTAYYAVGNKERIS